MRIAEGFIKVFLLQGRFPYIGKMPACMNVSLLFIEAWTQAHRAHVREFTKACAGLCMLTSAGMPSADRCQDFSICLKAAFSFAFCGSLLLCSEHHFCAPFSSMIAAQNKTLDTQSVQRASSPARTCQKHQATSIPGSSCSVPPLHGRPHRKVCDDV